MCCVWCRVLFEASSVFANQAIAIENKNSSNVQRAFVVQMRKDLRDQSDARILLAHSVFGVDVVRFKCVVGKSCVVRSEARASFNVINCVAGASKNFDTAFVALGRVTC